MHPRDKTSVSEGGFSQIEVLLSIILFSTAIVATMELYAAMTARITLISQIQRDARGPQYVVSTFASALNRAIRCELYPDRATFEQYPALGGIAGNFAVLWLDDGRSLAFELTKSELRILEDPNLMAAKERVFATGVESPQGLCTAQNGMIAIQFFAQIGTTQNRFQFCARPCLAR